jgi:mono/diheme cytochrome c family protein
VSPRSLPIVVVILAWINGNAALAVDEKAKIPAATQAKVDFDNDIKPIFQARCLSCHARGKYKGGLSLETREALLHGGEEGPAAVVGKSAESALVHLTAGLEEGRRMPQKGPALTPHEIGLLRGWIDQGLRWPEQFSFGFRRASLAPRHPKVPSVPAGSDLHNPIDLFLARDSSIKWTLVSGRVYARRVYLDLVGMLPTPKQLEEFEADTSPDKRARLVADRLHDRRNYAEHWLSFWNDALRNAYRGTGFIDGGRKTLTGWLFKSLYDNKPYDRFVHELISPPPDSGAEAFTKGIVWRGVVNASQAPPVQAAQNVAQVFLGTNLKCASCHDSFVNYWKLTDAYSLASVFADKPLELHRCDKPTGKTSTIGFVYPELGDVDDHAPRAKRQEQLADLIIKPENGRLARTVVNRLWAALMGRGLVEPLDDMDQEPWNQDLLDWLAADFVAHQHDVTHTLDLIATSRAYQLPSVDAPRPGETGAYVFRGPHVKRLSAEQFADALSSLTGDWPQATADMLKVDGRGQGGQAASVRAVIASESAPSAAKGKRRGPEVEPRWIWSHANAVHDPGGRILLRKTFLLAKMPKRAVVAATCDNELVLYVNGHKAGASADWTKPLSVEITKWLRVGENVVAVEATNWPDPKHGKGVTVQGANPAGFLARVGLTDGAQERQLPSDESWLWSETAKGDWTLAAFDAEGWQHAAALPNAAGLYGQLDLGSLSPAPGDDTPIRAALEFDDPLLAALGRTNREQVVTRRESIATTLQALELINGKTLDDRTRAGARQLLAAIGPDPDKLIRHVFLAGLGRAPRSNELAPARDLVGRPATVEGVQDLLWAVVMLPEFQLIE